MKNALKIIFLTLAVAIPSFADEGNEDLHQSFLSYDDGGTIVRSAEDGRELEAHRNLPIYPGDEVVTARRGRAEVRLSDGNIIGIDRTTAVRFHSILDSYDGENEETVAELLYGKVAVHRTELGRDHVRLDTDRASYLAAHPSVYSVETDASGRDRVVVFSGSVEVRTPTRATRVGSGQTVTVDADGVYDLVGDRRSSADDFERWFLERAERFEGFESDYVGRELGYWADDLDEHGRWVNVTGIGWTWRPYVSTSWRPYYNGYWHHRGGSLVWVSHDPWGWGTYHYGRWAHDPFYGWVWVPGYAYSPAWVYWMYGSGYVGWAPAGYWDCYRPYYNWAYSPYRSHYGFGFYGRVRVSEIDLRPWTFVDSGTLISNRIDRAALTTDAVKQRLGRSRDGFATIGGGATRMTREEWKDPADAIRRRGLNGRFTGAETGAPPTDVTPFVRRDANVPSDIRDRVIRTRGPVDGGSSTPARTAGGGLAPIGRGSVAPVGRGSVAPITGAGRTVVRTPVEAPVPTTTPSRRGGDDSGRIGRGATPAPAPATPTPRVIETKPPDSSESSGRRRAIGGSGTSNRRDGSVSRTPAPERPQSDAAQNWRSRTRSDDSSAAPASTDRRTTTGPKTSDVPARVIDRIGGARIRPRTSTPSRTPDAKPSTRSSSPRTSTRSRSSGSDGNRSTARPSRGSSSSGNGSSTRSSTRSSSGNGSSTRSSTRSSSGNGSSGRSSGGRIKRD